MSAISTSRCAKLAVASRRAEDGPAARRDQGLSEGARRQIARRLRDRHARSLARAANDPRCQAGKDAVCREADGHNILEGRTMVRRGEKAWPRSPAWHAVAERAAFASCMEYLKTAHLAKCVCQGLGKRQQGSIGKRPMVRPRRESITISGSAQRRYGRSIPGGSMGVGDGSSTMARATWETTAFPA